jgi:ParB/RepB/Spo0J family partition protein
MMDFREVRPAELHPNPWNPNVMSQEDYDKALESIERFGFVDPITVREDPTGFEIIDGENRWRAAIDSKLPTVPIIVLEVSDDDARALTIVLNELRGQPDQTRLAALVADLASRQPMAELERVLPFRRSQLAQMVAARREEIDWDRLQAPKPVAPADEPKTRWVERVFRLPSDAAAVVDDAIARATAGGDAQPWQGLEAIAAEFIATHGAG